MNDTHPLALGMRKGLVRTFEGDPLSWMEEHLRLPHSARSTQFDRTQSPWLNAPFLAVCDDDVKQIVIRANTGGGKTTFLEMVVPWVIARQPGGMLIVGQGDEEAKEWAESRLLPVLESCPPVAKLFPQDRHKKRKTEVFFPHMPLFIAGANMSSLQEKSMRYCYGDETWRWKTGMIGEMKKRHHDRWNRKTILVSQGWGSSHDMEKEWASGEVHEWGTTCAGCSQWHLFAWENIRYEEQETPTGEMDFQATMATARHVCPLCAHETPDTTAARRAMAERGSYRGAGGNYIAGHLSFTWSALSVWWVSWGDLVLEWLKARKEAKRGNLEPTKQFIQKRLAQVWQEDFDTKQEWSDLEARQTEYDPAAPWEFEHRRFLTVDVQKDHFWFVCRAWALGGASRLIEFGRFNSFEELPDLVERLGVQPCDVGIDSGFNAPQVYRQCVASKGQWKPFKGDQAPFYSVKGVRKAFLVAKADPFMGTTDQGRIRLPLYVFSNLMVKDILSLHVRGMGAPWEVPVSVPGEYMKQMTAETRREVNGRPRWEPLRKGMDNHAWDAECMQVVCALAAKLMHAAEPEPDRVEASTG